MYHHSYIHPKDIMVHFLGETRIDMRKRNEIRKAFQFVGFLIFRMISNKEESFSRFCVTVMLKNGIKIIRLYKNSKSIFVMVENLPDEWVIRLDGTKEDIKDFVIEYTVKALADNKKKA